MKAFSIQQPWGSLICSGLKDVENRSWALKSAPTRLLIHTGAKRQQLSEDDMPLIWWLPLENAQKMGTIGNLKTLPTSAIIGVATIDKCISDSDSIWAGDGHGAEYKWVIKDARLFKNPITNVKGRLGIFEVPFIDEDELPECINIPLIERIGNVLSIPLNREELDKIATSSQDYIEFNLTDENLHLFADKDLNPLDTQKVRFYHGDEILSDIDVTQISIIPVEDEPGNGAIIFEDALGRNYEWWKVRIVFED